MAIDQNTDLSADKPAPDAKNAAWWLAEIARNYGDSSLKKYRTRARKVIDRYRDERNTVLENQKRFNILFSNTETLRPAIYSRVPNPDVRRRFLDRDPAGRVAADVLQRSLSFSMDSYDADAVLNSIIDDYILPGFAVARVKYKPYTKQQPQTDASGAPVLDDKGKPVMTESLVYQEVCTEYVQWDHFAWSKARNWERVWWIAFYEDLSREEVADSFGQTVATAMKYTRTPDGEDRNEDGNLNKVRVWEVWNKRTRQRFFVAEGNDVFTKDPEDDPLRLEGFWPIPRPLMSISTNGSMVPIPEYLMYQDQAQELDDITERIDVLTSALRRRGVYDAQNSQVLENLANAGDNQFKPIENWQALMEKGGLANIIAELPIDNIAKIVMQLHDSRDKIKQTIYEVTGISDIVRGVSNPNETLGAQQMKGKWAGMRISTRRDKFAKFTRDLIRLQAEIIAERFRPEEFEQMSGIKLFKTVAEKQQAAQAFADPQAAQQMAQQYPDAAAMVKQPTWEEVLAVLKNDKLRGFRIDIETDSTVQPNADEEKQRRTEMLTAVTGYLQQAGPLVQQGVMPVNLAKELLQFGIRGFQVGSQVEQALDELGGDQQESPQVQQAKQQIQAQQQELAQREQAAKENEVKASLAAKDTENQRLKASNELDKRAAEVKRGEDMLALRQEMEAKIKAFEKQIESIHADAAKQVADAVGEAQNLAKTHVERASGEASKAQQQYLDEMKARYVPPVKKGPRRLRIVDQPDGSTLAEEITAELEPGHEQAETTQERTAEGES